MVWERIRRGRLVAGVLAVVLGAGGGAAAVAGPGLVRNASGDRQIEQVVPATDQLWVGSSYVTAERHTTDVGIGYSMRSDFWFRIDRDGNITGRAYAGYQPTRVAVQYAWTVPLAPALFQGTFSCAATIRFADPGLNLAPACQGVQTSIVGRNSGTLLS